MGYYQSMIVLLPAMIFAFYAQAKVSSTFKKYSSISNRRGVTASDVARKILDNNGLYNVKIERVHGDLTDHFDPKAQVIRLSDTVHSSTSIAAIGIAAHEVGHAVQHQQGYAAIKIRNAILPIASIGSYAAFPLAIFGLVLSLPSLVDIGIILFGGVILFQLITLPVEFNASRRAIDTLEGDYILSPEELRPAKKVLSAAAMTYIAAVAVTLANLLRLLLLRRRS